MKCFENVNIYKQGQGLTKGSLCFSDVTGGFSAFGNKIAIPSDAFVLPAFIDEHIHGAGGFDFSDGDAATSEIAKILPIEGTAYFLATTMTIPKPDLIKALRDYKACDYDGSCAAALGVHLEGPFISQSRLGAQNESGLSKVDTSYFKELFEASGGDVKLMTIAPELENSSELIKAARGLGVEVSFGHTDATARQIEKSEMKSATHLFNAMRGIHHRDIGAAGQALLYDDIFVEIIADGIHLDKKTLQLVKKIKPKNKIICITDSIRAKGLPDGKSFLGGQEVFVKDGEARLKNGALAGSVLKMSDAFKNAVTLMGATIEEASDYCSANPAKHLGLYDKIGGIKEGKAASYVVLSRDYEVMMTIINGEIAYRA